MTRLSTVGIALLLLTACTAPVPPETPATSAEKATASHVYLACLFAAADKIDDHTSDATTIARAIIGGCQAEFMRWEGLELKGESLDESEGTMAGLEQGRLGVALNVVLRERTLAREGKHPSPN